MIFAIVVSLSQFITNISSEQSLYMSLPYLAPAIFLIGAILLFVGTFESSELEYLPFLKSIKYPLTIGTIIIMIAFIAMMILTPFWYVFTIIYVLFMLFIIWQHIFK